MANEANVIIANFL